VAAVARWAPSEFVQTLERRPVASETQTRRGTTGVKQTTG